jgi:hypothetical protein
LSTFLLMNFTNSHSWCTKYISSGIFELEKNNNKLRYILWIYLELFLQLGLIHRTTTGSDIIGKPLGRWEGYCFNIFLFYCTRNCLNRTVNKARQLSAVFKYCLYIRSSFCNQVSNIEKTKFLNSALGRLLSNFSYVKHKHTCIPTTLIPLFFLTPNKFFHIFIFFYFFSKFISWKWT